MFIYSGRQGHFACRCRILQVLEHNSGVSTRSRSECCLHISNTPPHSVDRYKRQRSCPHRERNSPHVSFCKICVRTRDVPTKSSGAPTALRCRSHNLLEHNSGVSTWPRFECCLYISNSKYAALVDNINGVFLTRVTGLEFE
jgi:hypothetical protein